MYVVGTCILWNNKGCCFIFTSLGVSASSNLHFFRFLLIRVNYNILADELLQRCQPTFCTI